MESARSYAVLSPAEGQLREFYAKRRFSSSVSRELRRVHLLLAVLRRTAKYGPAASRESGLPLARLAQDCWNRCRPDWRWPDDYYNFKLYLNGRDETAPHFLSQCISVLLLRTLNDRDESAILNDKIVFAAECARLGLPHIETVAYFEGGELKRGGAASAEQLPKEDLFVKATNLFCGFGAERWRFDPKSASYSNGDVTLSGDELLRRIRELSRCGVPSSAWDRFAARIPRLVPFATRELQKPRPYLIQKEMKVHPVVQPFTNGSLCTVRVVTGRYHGGAPSPIMAALRMPVGSAVVDNFAAGGIASPVDLGTGRLGPGTFKDPRKQKTNVHPDTGAQLDGTILPFWEDVMALALRAHDSFKKVATVGWDVAITPDGVKLVEANTGWCVEVVQMANDSPLGTTELPKMLASHLN